MTSTAGYSCAFIEWFVKCGRRADDATGMWTVDYDEARNGQQIYSVIHLDTVFHAAHLILYFGPHALPQNFDYRHSLDCFNTFYVSTVGMLTIILMNVL